MEHSTRKSALKSARSQEKYLSFQEESETSERSRSSSQRKSVCKECGQDIPKSLKKRRSRSKDGSRSKSTKKRSSRSKSKRSRDVSRGRSKSKLAKSSASELSSQGSTRSELSASSSLERSNRGKSARKARKSSRSLKRSSRGKSPRKARSSSRSLKRSGKSSRKAQKSSRSGQDKSARKARKSSRSSREKSSHQARKFTRSLERSNSKKYSRQDSSSFSSKSSKPDKYVPFGQTPKLNFNLPRDNSDMPPLGPIRDYGLFKVHDNSAPIDKSREFKTCGTRKASKSSSGGISKPMTPKNDVRAELSRSITQSQKRLANWKLVKLQTPYSSSTRSRSESSVVSRSSLKPSGSRKAYKTSSRSSTDGRRKLKKSVKFSEFDEPRSSSGKPSKSRAPATDAWIER